MLDAFGEGKRGHTDRAAHLHDEHRVPGWYAQGITVAYERKRGLRRVNQSCTGSFQVSVSKTVAAPVAAVADALRSPTRRSAWLGPIDPPIAAALAAAFSGPQPREVKSKGDGYSWLRFRLDGRTVEIRITAKPNGKGATVVADNTDLAGPEEVEELRGRLKLALERLRGHLAG